MNLALKKDIKRPQSGKNKFNSHTLSDSDNEKEKSRSSQNFSPIEAGTLEGFDVGKEISQSKKSKISNMTTEEGKYKMPYTSQAGQVYEKIKQQPNNMGVKRTEIRRYEDSDQSPNREDFGQSFNDNSYNREIVLNEDIPRALKYLRATEFSEDGWNDDDWSMNYTSNRSGFEKTANLKTGKRKQKDSGNLIDIELGTEGVPRENDGNDDYEDEYEGDIYDAAVEHLKGSGYPNERALGKNPKNHVYNEEEEEEEFDEESKNNYNNQNFQEMHKRQEDLETVAERSVESEMTYKASMLDYEGNRTSTKERIQRPFDSELFQSAEKREDKRYNYLISSLEFSKESLRDVKSAMNSSDKKRPLLSNTFGGKHAISHGLYKNDDIPERGGGSHYEQGLEVIDEGRERRPISDQHRLLRGSKYDNSANQVESERSTNSYKKNQQTNFEGVKKVTSFGMKNNNIGSPFSNELSGTPPETDMKARDDLEKYLTRSLTTSEKKDLGKEISSVKKNESKEPNFNNPNDSGNTDYYKQSNEKSFNNEKKQLNISELDVKLFSNDRNSYNFSSPHRMGGPVGTGTGGNSANSEVRAEQQERLQLFKITGFKGGSGTHNPISNPEVKDEVYEAMEREIFSMKEENQQLKKKINGQEETLEKLKGIQNELHAAYNRSQEDLEDARAQKEKVELETQQQLMQMNMRLVTLEDSNERASKKLQEKDSMIKKLEKDGSDIFQEKNNLQKRNEILSKRVQELELELGDLSEKSKANLKEIAKQKVMLKEQEGKLKSLKEIDNLKKERDQLADKLDSILNENQERDRSFKMKLDESMIEQKKKYEEKLNKLLTDAHYKYHNKQKKQAEQVDQLRNENQSLRNELQRRPSPAQTMESERRIATLERELEEVKQNAALNFQRSPKAETYKHIVQDLVDELKVNSITDVTERIRELSTNYKTISKFKERFLDMVMSCHPEGTFSGQRISLKQAWKWIKTVMEEYMKLRSQTLKNLNRVMTSEDSRIHEGILQNLMELLGVRNRDHIIRNVEILLQQYDDIVRILDKMKRVLKIDNIRDVRELERVIDTKFVPKLESINRAKIH